MSLVNRTTQMAEGSLNIRSPGVETELNRLDSYLTVLEDNRKAARFVPDDAVLALDMASFVCDRLQGRRDRSFIPVMRLSLALVQTETNDIEQ
ncbi:MAG: hypothetical protein J5803_05510 [Desulfovibrio sp.]|nr:hypothetical protein [Desulfovibrio sp.]